MLYGNEYSVIGDFKTVNTPIEILHNKCGKIFTPIPNNLIRGSKCFHCYGKKKKTTIELAEQIKKLMNDEYFLIGEYKTSQTKVKIKHNECGKTFEMTPTNFLNGHRCPSCALKKTSLRKTKTHDFFISEIKSIVSDEYEVLSPYKGDKTKILFFHSKCTNSFLMTPHNFLAGQRCPKCNISKGEAKIRRFLKGISFKEQFRIKECRLKRPLPFDFCVMENQQLKCLIEYDGEQHFTPRSKFGGEKALKETQKRDAIKNQYCKDNNIPLIRIPYWEYDNIETILETELKKLNIL